MSAPLSPTRRRHHQPARARKAIKVGEHGEITVVPLGTDSSGREVIVAAPASDGGDVGSYPSDWRPGKRVKVSTADGGLDHKRAPSDEDVEALLAALRADPLAARMTPGHRHQAKHGARTRRDGHARLLARTGHHPTAEAQDRGQHPERFRDRRHNLSRAVATLYDKHGLTYGRGHAGRKWRVASLVARGVPTNKVADVVGHRSIATTLGYLGRQGRTTDPQVIAAL